MQEKAEAAKARVAARRAELQEMLSEGAGAFSFYETDLRKMKEKKERLEAHRNNKNRFQVCSDGAASALLVSARRAWELQLRRTIIITFKKCYS
jgi:hypothetical protein